MTIVFAVSALGFAYINFIKSNKYAKENDICNSLHAYIWTLVYS